MPRVLVVDDKEENLYFLEVLLKSRSYQVDLARNGADALELARKKAPHLVISDILMPVMDGYSLCRQWKSDPALKGIPFIFYTATYTDAKDQAFALSLGADLFFIKPQEPKVFAQAISDTLRKHEAGSLNKPTEETLAGPVFLREYNEALVRKLEDKMEEIEGKNRQLEARMKEKEVLVQELAHRREVDLQWISASLELGAAASDSPEARDLAARTQRRIRDIALASGPLLKSQDLSRISLKDYLTDLSSALLRGREAAGNKIDLQLELEPLRVPLDAAISCGMAVSELFSNALTHAFPQGRPGTIRLKSLRAPSGEICLDFSDDGTGAPGGLDPRQAKTPGLALLASIVEQRLRGTLSFDAKGGVACRIRFKDEPRPARA